MLNRNNTHWQGLKETLRGYCETNNDPGIGYINSHFGRYTIEALRYILSLRIDDLQLKDILVLKGIYLDQEHNNITELSSKMMNISDSKILVPINLFNKHAVGLVFEKDQNSDFVSVKYLDSLNKEIPQELKHLIVNVLGQHMRFDQIGVEQQKYANCGAEVIENFILYLVGKRVSQEKAIELHHILGTNKLLNIYKKGVHLEFEAYNDDYYYAENYIEQSNYGNSLCNNSHYDNHNIEITGDTSSFY